MPIITSRQNPLAQRARAVRERGEGGLVFVEGLRLCEEAARSDLAAEDVLFTDRFASDERGARLLAGLRGRGARLAEVSEGVLDSVADTKTPQGVVLLARRPACDRASFERRVARDPLVVVLHRVNNPANVGASLRVAEAAGASGVVATEGSADLLSPKALRSAMGSAFRLPLWSGARFEEVIDWCRSREIETVSTDLGAKETHTEHDWRGARAVVCGAEAGGLTSEEIERADARVRIPMREPVESLNVAVALGLVLYEAARQRGFAPLLRHL
ncbi:MAG: RNA methyltransferase [Acidobacteriota bacterium]|nr:RNA methyltransferase [Acidobacteriota bacterium]